MSKQNKKPIDTPLKENVVIQHNPFFTLFTSNDENRSFLENKMIFLFESIFYEVYKRKMPLWYVKSKIVPINELIECRYSVPEYNNYVRYCKEYGERSGVKYGIQLVFDVDTSG